MVDKTLLKYIRDNLKAKFPAEHIRKALRVAGWEEIMIDAGFREAKKPNVENPANPAGGFLTRRAQNIIPILIILIALGLLAWAGLAIFQRINQNHIITKEPGVVQGAFTTTPELAQTQNQQRLADLHATQEALKNYFKTAKSYPKSLSELANASLLNQIPTDPQTNQPYLYIPLGNPPLDYEIVFILPADYGTLRAGLQTLSAKIEPDPQILAAQNKLVLGELVGHEASALKITQLGNSMVQPGQEVQISIQTTKPIDLATVKLILPNLVLTASKTPFLFQFSAMAKPGVYPLRTVGFDRQGLSYSATSSLVVSTRRP